MCKYILCAQNFYQNNFIYVKYKIVTINCSKSILIYYLTLTSVIGILIHCQDRFLSRGLFDAVNTQAAQLNCPFPLWFRLNTIEIKHYFFTCCSFELKKHFWDTNINVDQLFMKMVEDMGSFFFFSIQEEKKNHIILKIIELKLLSSMKVGE